MTDTQLSVESALETIGTSSAVGMWFHTYLDQWVEVRKPASGGKIAVTVHSETGYRLERSPLSRIENMIRTGHWVAFRSRPTKAGEAVVIDRMLRVRERQEVAEALRHMAKAFELLSLPDAGFALRALAKEAPGRETVLEACATHAKEGLDRGAAPAE